MNEETQRDPTDPQLREETFKDRLKREAVELDEKRSKLESFIHSDKFDNIDPVQRSLLVIQWSAMSTYSICLQERLQRL